MKAAISDSLKKYLLGSRVGALGGVIASLKSDLKELISNYMTLRSDIGVTADIDEITGAVVFGVTFSADEIYDSGDVLR
ncbi:MAG TPA: hypothetical protein H9693_05570 [Firmicutes bacterium]|nr:hypothetical protein [Bacillota bacterium]